VEAAVASKAASKSAKMWPGLVSMVSSHISCLGIFLGIFYWQFLRQPLADSGLPKFKA
jgi:hypothetical protein